MLNIILYELFKDIYIIDLKYNPAVGAISKNVLITIYNYYTLHCVTSV